MTPLARVAWGFVLVVIDVQLEGFDLVPDVVGWLLVLWGLAPLVGRSQWFGLSVAGAVLGALASLPQLVVEPRDLPWLLSGVTETAVVFAVCSGIRARAGAEKVARTAAAVRWADLGLAVLLVVLALAVGFRTVETVWAIPLVAVGLGVMVWFLSLLVRAKDDPALAGRPHAGA